MPIAAPGKDNHPATYNENAIKKVREKIIILERKKLYQKDRKQ